MELHKEEQVIKSLKQWGKATFSQSEKLLKGHEFRYMKTNGKSVLGEMLVLNYTEAPDGVRRLGIIVTKRFDKKAVQRKRAARIIREAYRLIKSRLTGNIWLVIIARSYLHERSALEVQQELLSLFEQENLLETD